MACSPPAVSGPTRGRRLGALNASPARATLTRPRRCGRQRSQVFGNFLTQDLAQRVLVTGASLSDRYLRSASFIIV